MSERSRLEPSSIFSATTQPRASSTATVIGARHSFRAYAKASSTICDDCDKLSNATSTTRHAPEIRWQRLPAATNPAD
jgi:hypothetical protein